MEITGENTLKISMFFCHLFFLSVSLSLLQKVETDVVCSFSIFFFVLQFCTCSFVCGLFFHVASQALSSPGDPPPPLPPGIASTHALPPSTRNNGKKEIQEQQTSALHFRCFSIGGFDSFATSRRKLKTDRDDSSEKNHPK